MFDGITASATALLTVLSAILTPVGGLTAAIVVLTLAARASLHPLTRRAVRGERTRLRLTPKLAALRRRHAKDPARLAEESMALYRSAGVSPWAGLLPTLAQAPVFILLYHTFSHQAGGTVLGQRLFTGAAPLAFAVLLAGLGLVAWLTSRRTGMLMRVNGSPAPAAVVATPTSTLLERLPRILPFATVASALVLPMALVIYLLTSTTWTLAENILLRRGLPS